jgi:putative phosphotransacetylase
VYLGLDLPQRISGNHDDTPGCTIMGPKGALTIYKGVIRAERHVHMSNDDMAYYGVRDGDYMRLKIDGPCGLLFDRVKVRFHPKVVLEVHIDTDEGNACDLESATHMELLK